jgi:hypothetical protein
VVNRKHIRCEVHIGCYDRHINHIQLYKFLWVSSHICVFVYYCLAAIIAQWYRSARKKMFAAGYITTFYGIGPISTIKGQLYVKGYLYPARFDPVP